MCQAAAAWQRQSLCRNGYGSGRSRHPMSDVMLGEDLGSNPPKKQGRSRQVQLALCEGRHGTIP